MAASGGCATSSSTPQNHNFKKTMIYVPIILPKINKPQNQNPNPPIRTIKQEPTEEQEEETQLTPPPKTRKKRSKSPGTRLIGRRIYDSVHGKTCHQCRQKTMDFSVTCTNQIADTKCPLHVCHSCLYNRYGENAEEAAATGDWKCPKCRGICNCSHCMKKKGCCPTGTLLRAAKANGFSSVSDMLNVKGSELIKEYKGSPSKKQAAPNEEGTGDVLTKRRRKNGVVGKSDATLKLEPSECCSGVENSDNLKTNKGNSRKKSEKIVSSGEDSSKEQAASIKEPVGLEAKNDAKSCLKPSVMKPNKKKSTCKIKLEESTEVEKIVSASVDNVSSKENGEMCGRANGGPFKMTDSEEHVVEKNSVETEGNEKGLCNNLDINDASLMSEITLPKGTELTKLAGIDIPPEDIGNALQFLEFCEAFAQVLNIEKGQPECLLQEIASSPCSGQTHDQSVAQFHIKLLSIIQENSENDYAPTKTEGRHLWTDALSKFIFESESPSKTLLLGCSSLGPDEYKALTTSRKLRLLIFLCDEALGTAKLRSWLDKQNSVEQKKAKEMEKSVKKKLQDELVKATLVKNGAPLTISEHQNLVSKIKAEAAEKLAETLKATEMLIKKQQTGAVRSEPILTEDGRRFWKLKSYSSKLGVLLQDVCNGDLITSQERWFAYNVQEITMVEKYISSPRKKNDQGRKEACPSFSMVKQEVM